MNHCMWADQRRDNNPLASTILREWLSYVPLAVAWMSASVLEQVFVWHTTAMPYQIFPLMLREDLGGRLKSKYYGLSYFDFNIKDT